MYERILVPIDGSEPSKRALSHAVKLAKVHGSKLMVISVVEELKLPFGAQYMLYANESHQELIRATLESINKEITAITQKELDIEIEGEIFEGSPASTILKQSKDYDLIVIGKQGMRLLEELVMGSVTNKVVNSATIPVTVVV
jgi:nucleotide-binding universal stress UspA family protein